MATDAVTLSNQGLMYASQTAPQWQLMKLSLLQQILHTVNPMAATDPTSLLANAGQYQTYGPQCWQLMELALLAQLLQAFSLGAVQSGTGAPAFTPTSGTALWIQTDSVPPGLIWEYYNGAWH